MSMSESLADQLAEAAFALADSSLGCPIRQISRERSLQSRIVTEGAQIAVGYNYNHISITLMPTQQALAPEMDETDLQFVLAAVAPELPETERLPRLVERVAELRPELERRFCQLNLYGLSLLTGDETAWLRVRSYMDDFWKFRRRGEHESLQEYIGRLRTAAVRAVESEDYWTASDLFTRVSIAGGKLSREDRAMRREAQKHLFPML